MANTNTRWTHVAGKKGKNRVRVFEDPKRGFICMEWYEGGRRRSKSLGHSDRTRAEGQAELAAARFDELCEPVEERPPEPEPLNLGKLFDSYGESPKARKKTHAKRSHDAAASEMFRRYFGEGTLVVSLDADDFESFVQDRRAGRIAPTGSVSGATVRDRMIEYDLRFLKSVFQWATTKRNAAGEPLLGFNPMSGFEIPTEPNPRRPLLYEDEYVALLAAAGDVDWRFKVMLVLAHETGHRSKSIRELLWSDIGFTTHRIHWRASSQKNKYDHWTRISPAAMGAIELAREMNPAVGNLPVLPSPTDPSKPVSRELAITWWYRAEEIAGIARVKGRAWHSLRRKFATERKTAPLPDLAEAGGWKDYNTILKCYQRPDEDGVERVVLEREPLRRRA